MLELLGADAALSNNDIRPSAFHRTCVKRAPLMQSLGGSYPTPQTALHMGAFLHDSEAFIKMNTNHSVNPKRH